MEAEKYGKIKKDSLEVKEGSEWKKIYSFFACCVFWL